VVPKRFLEKVSMEPMSGCWIWTAAITNNGYGRYKQKGKTQLAHRVSYELQYGPIKAGMTSGSFVPDEVLRESTSSRNGHHARERSPRGNHYCHEFKENPLYSWASATRR
jgi:hypothetical protein